MDAVLDMYPIPNGTVDRKHVKRWNYVYVVDEMYCNGYDRESIDKWLSCFGVTSENIDQVFMDIYGEIPASYKFGKKTLTNEDGQYLAQWFGEGWEKPDWVDSLPSGVKFSEGVVQFVAEHGPATSEPEDIDGGEALEFSVVGPGEEPVKGVVDRESKARALVEDPLPVFEQLNTYTLMVAQGLSNALLVTGQGGVGKSYNVTRVLSAYGKKGKDFVVMKGKSSISAMYKFLYDNYDKIVVFDDCDSVLQDDDGLNILKGVLDSGEIREVSWNTSGSKMVDTFGCESHAEIEDRLKKWSALNRGKEGIPTYFRFIGACIFISNMSAEQLNRKAAMAPLLTRCTTVDINLTPDEVVKKMEVALPTMKIFNTRGDDITNEALKQEVFEYISSPEFLEDPRLAGKPLSFRCLISSYKFRYAGLPNWKELSFCI